MALIPIPNEFEILNEVLIGNEAAFKALFKSYSNQIAKYVFYLTQSKQQTEEIVHDVFLKVWSNRDRLSRIESFTSYLFILTKNHTLNTIQKDLNERKVNDKYYTRICEDAEDIEDELSDVRLKIIYYINQLPSQQKQVMLYKLNGVKNKVISDTMNLSPESVRKYQYLAINSIIKRLKMSEDAASTVTILLFFTFFLV